MSRPFDSFYDPIYTSASARTVPEFTNKVILPHYPNMFAEGQNFPAKSILLRNQPFNITTVTDGNYLVQQVEVGGADRFRYFRRPLVPYLPTFVVNRPETAGRPRHMNAAAVARHQKLQQQLQQQAKQQNSHTSVIKKRRDDLVDVTVGEDIRSVGVQTLYRDSEAQTLPYSPPYVIGKLQPKGAIPELVRLGHLVWGNGLPVTMDELDLIEREQNKRRWFESLPPLAEGDDGADRQKERAKREAEDWEFRENQIQRLQDERLELVKQVIREKNARLQEWHHTRIDRAWQTKLQEREAVRVKIEKQRQKLLKVLADRRAKFGPQNTRRDIIAEHDKAKDLMHIAVRGPIEIAMKVGERDLQEALANLPIRDLRTDNAGKETVKKNPYTTSEIDERNWNKTISNIYNKMSTDQEESGEPETFRLLKRVEKPPVRPKTPEITRIDPSEDRLNRAALLLQRLMRGRVVQNAMHEGKSRRLDLINELRYRDALSSSVSLGSLAVLSGHSNQDLNGGQQTHQQQQQQQHQLFDSDNLATLFEAHVQSEYIGKRLHFLTHQLTRLREMRRIDALVALAERTRDQKESLEIGRRGQELDEKARRDLIWREVMEVHSETVDSFLEAAVLDGIKDVSSDVARERVWEDVRRTKAIMDSLGSAAEQPVDEEQVVRDLVSSFLLPEVNRESIRKQVELQQIKYLNAAKQTIEKLFE